MTDAARGLYYEDLAVGDVFRSNRRRVEFPDIDAFASLTGDRNPLHVRPEFAATTLFGTPIAHGLFGLSLAVGLFEELELFHGTAIAFLGISNWAFSAPIYPGDEVFAKLTISRKRLSRNDPGRGIVDRDLQLINQRNEVVQHGAAALLIRTRTSRPPG